MPRNDSSRWAFFYGEKAEQKFRNRCRDILICRGAHKQPNSGWFTAIKYRTKLINSIRIPQNLGAFHVDDSDNPVRIWNFVITFVSAQLSLNSHFHSRQLPSDNNSQSMLYASWKHFDWNRIQQKTARRIDAEVGTMMSLSCHHYSSDLIMFKFGNSCATLDGAWESLKSSKKLGWRNFASPPAPKRKIKRESNNISSLGISIFRATTYYYSNAAKEEKITFSQIIWMPKRRRENNGRSFFFFWRGSEQRRRASSSRNETKRK